MWRHDIPRGTRESNRLGVSGERIQIGPTYLADAASRSVSRGRLRSFLFAPAFIGLPIVPGTRFFGVAVSEFNAANNPVREFVFNQGTADESHVFSSDPGRALISGIGIVADPTVTLEKSTHSRFRRCGGFDGRRRTSMTTRQRHWPM